MECSSYHTISIVVLLLLISTCDCQKQTFYITSSDTLHCPHEVNTSQCYNISTLVSEGHLSMAPNISLLFLPGEHFLEQDLDIKNIKAFQAAPYNVISSAKSVKIVCSTGQSYSSDSCVKFQNVSFVTINSILFQSCGAHMDISGGLQLRSVYHSEITNCKWNKSRSSALVIEDSNCVISDCQFTSGNCNNCSGGGIRAVGSNVTFSGSNVVADNRVLEGNGGGLSLTNSNAHVNGNLTFDGNFVDSVGGGMFVEENCTFTTTTTSVLLFENNKAHSGGSLYVKNSQCAFNGYIRFFSNAANLGGGVYVSHSQCIYHQNVWFASNSAAHGGGMLVVDSSHCIFSRDVEFSGNIAVHWGGAMAVRNNSRCTFNGRAEFSDNSAGNGGGMAVTRDSQCTFNGHVMFTGNSAFNWGGGMVVRNSSHCTFTGRVQFSGNNANFGGGMSVRRNSHCTFNRDAEFSGNSAGKGGGMEVRRDSHCTFNGRVSFSGNSAGFGGGIEVIRNSNCTFITHVEFSGNSADDGGGISVRVDSRCTFGGHVDFSGNNATDDGGGMSVSYSHITFNESVGFSENSAFDNGGGLLVRNTSYCIFNGPVEFSRNYASSGGGMRVFISHCTFNETVGFYENRAHVDGGGMTISFRSRCTFVENVVLSGNSATKFGGGMSISYSWCTFIESVEVSDNSARLGGGISCLTDTHCTFKEHINFSGNSAKYGGGMYASSAQNAFYGHVEFSSNSAGFGGGMYIYFKTLCAFNGHVNFSGNSAEYDGGSVLAQYKSSITFDSLVIISSSTAGWEGGGVLIRDGSLLKLRGEIIMNDNSASSYGGAISLDSSKLRVFRGNGRIINNYAQYGGAIHAISSKLYFSGDLYFENNHAQFGGGVALSEGSRMYFPNIYTVSRLELTYFYPKLNMQFISNHADEYGGAIWMDDAPYYSCTSDERIPQCFATLRISRLSSKHQLHKEPLNSSVTTINNTAKAGSNIYGGNINRCLKGLEDHLHVLMPFLNETNSISSDPKQVCLCKNNKPDCSITTYSIKVFSGQQFALTLVGVGERDGTVPVVILSHTDPPQSIDEGSDTQSATGSCSELFYTITSDKPSVKIMLYPESVCHENALRLLTVNVNIKPCPPGFMLDETTSCTCNSALKELDSNIQCDINPQSFSHQHGVWIGNDQQNDFSQTVIYHPHCPFDYCILERSTFTLNSTDDQCRYNRSGLICGACSEGYSLTLGGSKCRKCSHVYLALFIPLVLAGVVLVLLLLILKLTVTMGTMNGLIFFANIIGTNSSIFLPPDSTVVLRIFIAWLNLDLGIDTCLFDGLDMYIKVWLQFLFPFYVFMLIVIIIFVSQRSTLITRCLGSDPVAVLATLILLAYTKLLRTVLTIMSFTYIRGLDGSSTAVWLYDGNIRYLSGKHIPLFMFALLIMLLFIIPFTVILLFGPYIQRYSEKKVLSWIDDHRLKPFLLSYYAPLKDKYRSWIGFLLAVRLCLLIVFVSNSLGDPSINLFAINTVVVLLLSWRVLSGTVYTDWRLDALEIFFLMKLCLFSVSALYVLHTSGNQRALTDTLVGVAFIVFIAIIVYHVWKQLTDSRWWRLTMKPKWQKYFNSKNEEDPGVPDDSKQCKGPQTPPNVPTTVIELPKFPNTDIEISNTVYEVREPVLEFS